MLDVISGHRSIRRFKPDAIPANILRDILEAGTRASNTGNMQVYSVVVTTRPELREALSPCHFNQPCVRQAPVLMTFCADINRFSKWCIQNNAMPEYNNFAWFLNSMTDVVLVSQNVALQAEDYGLGIVYLGTTIYTAEKISEILELPQGVIPVTTIAMGYPDEFPQLTDRLPLEAVIHFEKYSDYSEEDISRIYSEREGSEETARLLEVNGLPNLARIFTEKRYKGEDNREISRTYFELLKKKGFFNQ